MNMLQMPETENVRVTEPLDLIGKRIDAAYNRLEGGRKECIEGSIELAMALSEARRQIPKHTEFHAWLIENGHDYVSAPYRSSLIRMAAHPKLTRTVLEETNSYPTNLFGIR